KGLNGLYQAGPILIEIVTENDSAVLHQRPISAQIRGHIRFVVAGVDVNQIRLEASLGEPARGNQAGLGEWRNDVFELVVEDVRQELIVDRRIPEPVS